MHEFCKYVVMHELNVKYLQFFMKIKPPQI